MLEPDNDILKGYASSEISKYIFKSQDIMEKLEDIAFRYIDDLITYQEARNLMIQTNVNYSIIERIHEIKTMNDNPIPSMDAELRARHERKRCSPWREYEDLRLITAIWKFGVNEWKKVSQYVGNGRTSSQCNQRWARALNPEISHDQWTPNEDQALINAVENENIIGWRQIAARIPGRTDLQCRYRYIQLGRKSGKKTEIENPIEEITSPSTVSSMTTSSCASSHDLNLEYLQSFSNEVDGFHIPYYLNPQLKPCKINYGEKYLHRIPPLLFFRQTA